MLGQRHRKRGAVARFVQLTGPYEDPRQRSRDVRIVRLHERRRAERRFSLRQSSGARQENAELVTHDRDLRVRARDVAQVIDCRRVLLLTREHRRFAMGLEDARLLFGREEERFVGDRGDRAQVAQRRVLVFVGRSDLSRRLHRPSLDQAIELRSQASRLRIFGRRRGDAAALEIDQLLTFAANVEVLGVRDRELRGSPEPEVLGQRLSVNRPVRHLAGVPLQDRAQRAAPEVGRNGRPNQVEDGRQNVDVLHRHGDTAAGPFAIRLLDQQRHPQRRIIERGTGVGRPAVGGEDDRRLVVEAELLELAHQLSHRRLRAALVDLDEQEESPAAPGAHPAGGRIGGFGAVAFDRRQRRVSLIRQLRVEERKSLRHARFGAQQERRYRRTRFESAVLQQLCHRLRVFFQREASLVAHAMLERQLPGQDRGMRGKCQRRVRVGALEDDGVSGERIDRGSRRRNSRCRCCLRSVASAEARRRK